jgi:hypothetical protein
MDHQHGSSALLHYLLRPRMLPTSAIVVQRGPEADEYSGRFQVADGDHHTLVGDAVHRIGEILVHLQRPNVFRSRSFKSLYPALEKFSPTV